MNAMPRTAADARESAARNDVHCACRMCTNVCDIGARNARRFQRAVRVRTACSFGSRRQIG
jgi:hypothetical protein